MPEPPLLFCLAGIVLTVVIAVGVRRAVRFQAAVNARAEAIKAAESPIFMLRWSNQRVQFAPLAGRPSPWRSCVLAVSASHLLIYDRSWTVDERLRVAIGEIRWFGRPEKYHDGNNDIWLHIEQDGGWSIVKIRLSRSSMADFVRALKAVAPAELVTAYRRRRPYIHAGPDAAQPATQDIHGAWTLDEPVDLYLMPRYLLILRGGRLLRKLALEAVQQIAALRRLDAPGSHGLVRFRAEDETFAFAHPRYEAFAGLLAEAAKRTLEAPLERKQKGKADDVYDDEWDDDM